MDGGDADLTEMLKKNPPEGLLRGMGGVLPYFASFAASLAASVLGYFF